MYHCMRQIALALLWKEEREECLFSVCGYFVRAVFIHNTRTSIKGN